MAADRILKAINKDGTEVEFREDFESPYILMGAKGIHSFENNVITSENTMTDGSTYQGTTAKQRNIVLYIKDLLDFYDHRNHLNAVFVEGEPVKLIATAEGVSRSIEGYIESINGDEIKPDVHFQTISIICPNPFFTTVNPSKTYLAQWIPFFEWKHEFLDVKEPFGYRSRVRMRTIRNVDATDNIGMTIKITCSGNVTNPMISLIERNQHIQLGSQSNPFSMVPGDVVTITTGTANKHVWFTHEGETEEINYLMTEDSEYIQLKRGTNSIGYDADAGADFMIINIEYNMTYSRA